MGRKLYSTIAGSSGKDAAETDSDLDRRLRQLEDDVREIRRLLQHAAPNGDRLALSVLDHRVQELQRRIAHRNGAFAHAPTRTRRAFDKISRYLKRLPGIRARARRRALLEGGAIYERLKDPFVRWIELHEPDAEEKRQIPAVLDAARYVPKISVLLTIKRPAGAEPHRFIPWLARTFYSVFNQPYPSWELCVAAPADPEPLLAGLLHDMTRRDRRVRLATIDADASPAEAWNAALDLASGDYIHLLEQCDQLEDTALCELALALQDNPPADLVYSDEDAIDSHGNRSEWNFKPEWSPDLLASQPYLGRTLFCRRELVEQAGGFQPGFDGAELYELCLRLKEVSPRVERSPRFLYHRGRVDSFALPQISAAPGREKALNAHVTRASSNASCESTAAGSFHIRRRASERQRVTVLVACPPSSAPALTKLRAACEDHPRARCEVVPTPFETPRSPSRGALTGLARRPEPRRFSAVMNDAARASSADYLLFLAHDVKPEGPDSLSALLDYAVLTGVGAVGGLLASPEGRIRHAGYVLGAPHVAGDAFRGRAVDEPSYNDLALSVRNVAAVSRGCLMVRRELFEQAGGFEERLSAAYQDVDLCLKLRELGYRNVYTPLAKFLSTSPEPTSSPASALDVAYMLEHWAEVIEDDPYYHPGLSRGSELYRLRLEE